MHGPGGRYEQPGWPQPANGSASESVQGLHAAAFLSAAPTAAHGHAWGVTPEQAPSKLRSAETAVSSASSQSAGPGWSRRDPAGPTGVILGP